MITNHQVLIRLELLVEACQSKCKVAISVSPVYESGFSTCVITYILCRCFRGDHGIALDGHVHQLHNCAERHQKLKQVLNLLEQAHQQGSAPSSTQVEIVFI